MKKAFTLTEVLIALSIIGIIAVLTIPSLVVDTSNQAFSLTFKNAYENFQEGLISAENVRRRPIIKVGEDADNLAATKNDLLKFMRANFAAAESDRAGITENDLVPHEIFATYKLKSGVQVLFPKSTIEKMKDKGCTNDEKCIIFFDVNGKKGPNEIVRCTEGTTDDTPTDEYCYISEDVNADIYPLWLKDSYISPQTNAVEYILSK